MENIIYEHTDNTKSYMLLQKNYNNFQLTVKLS